MIPQYEQDYLPQQYNSSNEISLVSQTNPDKVLFEIEMKLRGRKPFIDDDGNKKWIVPDGCRPLMNDKGINSFMADASSVINQNTIMSNLSEEEISKLIIDKADSIIDKLISNYKEFEIEESDLNTIHDSIIVPAFMSLKRAMREGEKRFLKTSVRAVETYATNQKDNYTESPSNKIKFWRD